MKKFIILSLFIVSLASCEQKGIEKYDDANYLVFQKGIADTTRLSFFFYFKDEIEYPVEVNLIGKTLEQDTEYSIVIDESVTDAPDYIFKMPETFTFHKGNLKDTFYVKLINAEEMKTKMYKIGLKVADTNGILATGNILGRTIIIVSDKAQRPEWWTTNEEVVYGSFESTYLGTYSDRKFELFMEVTGVVDMKDMSEADKRTYSIIFKRWLKAQSPAIYDDANGEYMTVTVIGD